jgi:uncharacterized OB-fold protein
MNNKIKCKSCGNIINTRLGYCFNCLDSDLAIKKSLNKLKILLKKHLKWK